MILFMPFRLLLDVILRNLMFYYIIQFGPWNIKSSQMVIICLLLSVSLSVSFSVICTSKQWANVVALHGEGYTDRDIAAPLRCTMTAVHKFNADGTFNDRNRSGRPWKTTPGEDRSMRQIVIHSPKSSARKSMLFYA